MLPSSRHRWARVACAALTLACSAAFAVTTSRWTHNSESDFKEGTLHHVIATSNGDMHLSRAITTLVQQDPRFSLVAAMAEAPDGSIYLGTGPSGLLLQWKDGKTRDLLSLGDGVTVSALALDAKGGLLIGTGGTSGKVLLLPPGEQKPKTLLQDPAVLYVWALLPGEGGSIYAATGPEGNLYEVKPDGSSRVVFHSNDANILSLIDGGENLYAGTSPRGLIYRISKKTGEGFVLYDAPETDITALLLDKNGMLYAATGAETETGEAEPSVAVGRPEAAGAEVPIRSEPPTTPKPPVLPDPTPGEPEPIPKGAPAQPAPAPAQPAPAPAQPAPAKAIPDAAPKNLLILTDDAGDVETPAKAPSTATTRPTPRLRRARPAPTARPAANDQGNAVYRISPEGFVTEIFRQPALFYSMALQNQSILIGSGSDGVIYQHDIATSETLAVARVEAMDVTTLLLTRAGKLFLGLSNAGGMAEMTPGYATSGTFTSPVLDATQVSRFGTMQLVGTLAANATLTASFRSANVEDPDEPGWSKWSPEVPATEFIRIPSPAARFLQYRLTFTSTAGDRSAAVEEVDISYQMPNLPPVIRTVAAEHEAGTSDGPSPNVGINWEASDANGDTMRYQLQYRMGRRAPWIELKKDLRSSSFTWNTRTVADGRYQLRLTASDAPSNPEGGKTATRLSDWVVVDNTPPVIGDVQTKVAGGVVSCQLRVVDRTSTVSTADFAVDSNDDWQAATASDNMLDSPDEAISFKTKKLAAGTHQIAVRATDSAGNRAYTTLVVTVE